MNAIANPQVPEVGERYLGTVVKVTDFGAFISLTPGKDGLLHISEIDWKRYEKIEDTGLEEGQQIEVKLIDIDQKTGKFKLSRRALLPKPEGYKEPERRPRPDRGERRPR